MTIKEYSNKWRCTCSGQWEWFVNADTQVFCDRDDAGQFGPKGRWYYWNSWHGDITTEDNPSGGYRTLRECKAKAVSELLLFCSYDIDKESLEARIEDCEYYGDQRVECLAMLLSELVSWDSCLDVLGALNLGDNDDFWQDLFVGLNKAINHVNECINTLNELNESTTEPMTKSLPMTKSFYSFKDLYLATLKAA